MVKTHQIQIRYFIFKNQSVFVSPYHESLIYLLLRVQKSNSNDILIIGFGEIGLIRKGLCYNIGKFSGGDILWRALQ
jgi:hypothetical protein